MTTVGNGKYTYDLVTDWAKFPEGEPTGVVCSVAVDGQGLVYVSQRIGSTVLVFDDSGNYIRSWDSVGISDPHGFYIADDVAYVADRGESVVLKCTLDGKILQVIGERGMHSDTGCEKVGDVVLRPGGPFNFPSKLFPAPSGDLYVSDGYRNCQVHKFSVNGDLIRSWGEPGKTEPNQFHLPHSVLVTQDDLVYVCDRNNRRVQIFSLDGQYVDMWTDLRRPTDIVVDKDGIFYISEYAVDGLPPRVSVVDKEGQVLSRWDSRSGHSLWVDSRGDIYLALSRGVRQTDPSLVNSVDKYVRREP